MKQPGMWPATHIEGDAIIKGPYRYLLRRRWGPGERGLPWIGLNPNSADASQDDATLRRMISFSAREGYSQLIVVNLFALRTTYPQELRLADDAIGSENDEHILQAAAQEIRLLSPGVPTVHGENETWRCSTSSRSHASASEQRNMGNHAIRSISSKTRRWSHSQLKAISSNPKSPLTSATFQRTITTIWEMTCTCST